MRFGDELEYGVVLTRRPNGEGGWHGHIGRSGLRYPCELLGRPTTMLFAIQEFATGTYSAGDYFLLTLDGEGVPLEFGTAVTFDWGERTGSESEKQGALRVRNRVLPALFASETFQRACWFVIDNREHETVADVQRMERLIVPPFEVERV
ncbi:MAG: hypothetical protein AVDCRST_MAG64-53 [uncultured Phycisphaerae bacterium]|uniref:Uncharacterized protein n=1 Tax=uncultured Phycisphaerae bacterium TaxID=904963 RepID=A0A6J4MYR0_9BACT|nr:MAG: hypothetical protein AVDCRST_MAG64-53 [uncultured Phycisphaerae bacterium]